MTRTLLDEARRHDAAMTDGPWYERGRFVSLTPVNTGMGATLHTNHIANLVEQDDAAGVAWLRTNLRGLLDGYEQALGEVERLKLEVDSGNEAFRVVRAEWRRQQDVKDAEIARLRAALQEVLIHWRYPPLTHQEKALKDGIWSLAHAEPTTIKGQP